MAKRAAAGDGSIRQRKDGLWECRVSLGFHPGTGKPIRKSVYAKTQAECRRKKTELLNSLDTKTYKEPSRITYKQWSEKWLETYVKPTLKPLTADSYSAALKTHLLPRLGTLRVQELSVSHVQGVIAAMTKDGKSPKTIKNTLAVLSKSLDAARKAGMITVNPVGLAEIPKAKKTEIHPLEDAEIPAFLAAAKAYPEFNAYALCLFAGLREAEVLGLSWDCVDFNKNTLTVRQQLVHGKQKGSGYTLQDSPKNGRSRTIQPPQIAFDFIRAERARQAEKQLRAGELWSNPWGLVFTNEAGEHLKIFTFYAHFKKIAESIGRPDLRPHDLRHSAATIALAAGADLKSVQELLGHAIASFTLGVYAHSSTAMKKDLADRMQGYFDSLDLGKQA